MRRLIAIIPLALALSSCAQTPEQAAAYRQFGMQVLSQQHAQPQQPRNMTCTPLGNSVNCRQW